MEIKFIEWNNKYSVKSKYFDDQHQEIIEIINELHDHFNKNNPEHIKHLIFQLVEYANTHLKDEEKFFAIIDFPLKEAHLKAHQFYIDEVKKIIAVINKNGIEDVNFEILKFLKEWWLTHITEIDQKYAPYLPKYD